ncbi:hypothetical protein, partial [Herminiimonas contaminans]
FCLLKDGNNLAFRKTRLLHVKLPQFRLEKILLSNSLLFRGDYHARRFQIYDMTIAFYNALSGDVNVDEFLDARRKFLMAVRESQFLFSPDSGIYETLLDLREKAFSIHGFKANSESLQSDPTLFIQLHEKMINELDSWDGLTSKIQKAMASHLNFHS